LRVQLDERIAVEEALQRQMSLGEQSWVQQAATLKVPQAFIYIYIHIYQLYVYIYTYRHILYI
jgi:hypothetical protein